MIHASDTLEIMLLDYATGALSQPESVLISTYMALNPSARRMARDFEYLGGLLIEELSPRPVSGDCLTRTLASIEALERQTGPATTAPLPESPEEELARLPGRLLASLARGEIPPELVWAHMLEGIQKCHLLSAAKARNRQQLDLFRLMPGMDMPPPSHRAETEIILVIQGSYEDHSGLHNRGDLSIVTQQEYGRSCRHQGCLTLTLTSRPLTLEDRLRQMLQDLLR